MAMDRELKEPKPRAQGARMLGAQILQFLAPPGTGRLSLRRNFSWNLIGNVIYAGCHWGMVVVLAKLTNPEMVGRFALGLAITAPIILFSQLQLRAVQATDARSQYGFGHYLGLRLATTGLALLVIAAVAGWGKYGVHTALVILAIGVTKAVESISDVFYGLMQRHERMDRIARSRILKGPLSLAALGGGVWATGNVFWGVVGIAAVWVLVLVTYDLRNARATLRECRAEQDPSGPARAWLAPVFGGRQLLRLAWLALPLGVVGALISLTSNIPRYFLEKYRGEAELGIFAALAYLVVVGNILVGAMGQSVVPRLAKYFAAGDIASYQRLLLRLLGIGTLIGLAGVGLALFAGRMILTLLYRPEYADHVQIFVGLMCAGGLSYLASIMGYGLTATRRFRVFILPYGFIACAAVLFGALWIPRHGAAGAAGALIAVNLTTCLVLLLLLWNILRRTRAQPVAEPTRRRDDS